MKLGPTLGAKPDWLLTDPAALSYLLITKYAGWMLHGGKVIAI